MKKQYPNYMRNQKNKLRERLDGQEHSLKKLAESKINYEENYGKYPELIKLGETDRIGGNSPKFIADEDMAKSYNYGFFKRGSRSLAGSFERGKYSAEEQRQFGIKDLNNGVKSETLFNLTDYPNYMNGRIYQMGRNSYYYITNNNLLIDDYINLMSLIYPEFINPEFRNGYYDEEQENKLKKR